MGQTLYEFCRATGQEHLLAEWDSGKNAPLTPETVTHGSRRKIWWRCEKGHVWQALMYNRAAGQGCPYCSGRRVTPETSLAKRFPALAAQWDNEKNAPLTPEAVLPGSGRKVWWLCEKQHSWQASVCARTEGRDCPICAGQVILPEENSLAVTHPALAAEWDDEKNAPLTPQQVSRGSGRRVWWRCEHGHTWKAAVNARANRGTGCPVCAGRTVQPGFNDLASRYPRIAAEWDREKNGALTPETVTVGNNRAVWWRCPLGHSYQMRISGRTAVRSGCPYCGGQKVLPGFNDLATVAPQMAAQWHPTLNEDLSPEQVLPGSHRKVWWQCAAGHVWRAYIFARTGSKATGCPVCAGKVRLPRSRGYAGVERHLPGGPRANE